MPRAERFGPGEEAQSVSGGDFILTHRSRLMPALISSAQRRRFKGEDAPYAHWSHCALIVDEAGGLVEAESRGVQKSPLSKYRSREYHLVRVDEMSSEGRENAVRYALAQVGSAFGYLVLLSELSWLLTGIRIQRVRRDHQICSGLVARALGEGGIEIGSDPRFTLPADLAKRFRVLP